MASACGGATPEEHAQDLVRERYPDCARFITETNPSVKSGIIGFDCGSAVDGPAYYLRESDGSLISTCGGACMRGPTQTEPKQWEDCQTKCPPPEFK